MQSGQIAGWLAWSSVVIVALIGGFFARSGTLINRRTSMDMMLLELLKTEREKTARLETEKSELLQELQVLRQSEIKGMIAQERLEEITRTRSVHLISIEDIERTGEG